MSSVSNKPSVFDTEAYTKYLEEKRLKNIESAKKYKLKYRSRKGIEKNIRESTINNKVSYEVEIIIGEKKFLKSFKKLKLAQNYKHKIFLKHKKEFITKDPYYENKLQYRKNIILKTIEKNIVKETNTKTNNIGYNVSINIDKKRYYKTFKTLPKARIFRDKMIKLREEAKLYD